MALNDAMQDVRNSLWWKLHSHRGDLLPKMVAKELADARDAGVLLCELMEGNELSACSASTVARAVELARRGRSPILTLEDADAAGRALLLKMEETRKDPSFRLLSNEKRKGRFVAGLADEIVRCLETGWTSQVLTEMIREHLVPGLSHTLFLRCIQKKRKSSVTTVQPAKTASASNGCPSSSDAAPALAAAVGSVPAEAASARAVPAGGVPIGAVSAVAAPAGAVPSSGSSASNAAGTATPEVRAVSGKGGQILPTKPPPPAGRPDELSLIGRKFRVRHQDGPWTWARVQRRKENGTYIAVTDGSMTLFTRDAGEFWDVNRRIWNVAGREAGISPEDLAAKILAGGNPSRGGI